MEKKTYYVTIELQCQEQAVVKVDSATNELEAEAFALKAFFGNYEVYTETERPACAEELAEDGCYIDENGEEIVLDEDGNEIEEEE